MLFSSFCILSGKKSLLLVLIQQTTQVHYPLGKVRETWESKCVHILKFDSYCLITLRRDLYTPPWSFRTVLAFCALAKGASPNNFFF